MIVYWVRTKSLTTICLTIHVNGRTALNILHVVCRKSYKVLQVIVSFCFISLKSNSEDSDTGTVLVLCLLMMMFTLSTGTKKNLISAFPSDKYCSAQILPALANLALFYLVGRRHTIPEPLPIGQVNMKIYLTG